MADAARTAFQSPRLYHYIDNTALPRSILESPFEFLGKRLSKIYFVGTWKSDRLDTIPFSSTAAYDALERIRADPAPLYYWYKVFRILGFLQSVRLRCLLNNQGFELTP